MDKEYLQKACRAVDAVLPDNHGFLLLVAPFDADGCLHYASSMSRECALNVLKEFLLRSGAAEDWMKHIK